MADYRERAKIFAFEIEGTSGTEEAPSVSADAIRAEGLGWDPQFEVEQTNEHTGSLDGDAPIVGAGYAQVRGECLLKGDGAGGTAPEFGDLLRAAAMSETLLASDESGTAQTGTSSTITLAASGPSSTDDVYNGAVIVTTGGTGSGQTRVITDYNGTSKVATVSPDWDTDPDNTTTYTIYAHAKYQPVSSGLETGTGYLWDQHTGSGSSRLRKVIGAVCAPQFRFPAGRVGRMPWTVMGKIPANPTDVSDPGDPTYDSVTAGPFLGATIKIGGVDVKPTEISFDLGINGVMDVDPTESLGYDAASVASRRITGEINPRQSALSGRNAFADFVAGTERDLWVNYGSTAGNRISIYCPAIRYTGAQPTNNDGILAERLPFEVIGQDTGIIVCFY